MSWLIFLDVVPVRCFADQFNVDYRVTMLLVLWALGWAMILLSAVVRLPTFVVTAIGALLIVGHNLLDSVHDTRYRLSTWCGCSSSLRCISCAGGSRRSSSGGAMRG